MNCNHCGSLMIDAFTTFTVVREDTVYVVKDVPCLECSTCGYISFTQEVATRLECLTSGRAIPARQTKAWVYKWKDPVVEFPRESDLPKSTTTVPLALGVTGTEVSVGIKLS